MIDRNDMLELTRRMTVKRHCMDRIAGGYLAADGIIDGTFNTNFRHLEITEQADKLAICKEIPFADTNVNLKEYRFHKGNQVREALEVLNSCELKDDALLEIFYEHVADYYRTDQEYCILFYHGTFDIPRKGSDKSSQWESDQIFPFTICAICPLYGEYEPGLPECGFLYPGYKDHGAIMNSVFVFQYDEKHPHNELLDILQVKDLV